MKFLHTADWQIGMKAAHVGAAGERVREQRVQTARRVVAAAKEHGAEFILVAGDTFEDNAVERLLVQKIGDILAEFGGPVWLLPGNHDPLSPGSVWEHPVWQSHPHLHVLHSAAPIEVPGGLLYALPLREKYSTSDPTIGFDAHDSSEICVGVAHGTVQGLSQQELDYPVARNAAQRAGLDYLALGHWHSTSHFPDDSGVVRLAYSGTHETTKFGERDSGNVVIVEIEKRGAAPSLTQVATGGLKWLVFEESIAESGDLARLRERIEAVADSQNVLVDVRLSGVLHSDEHGEVRRITEIVASRFLYGRIESERLLPHPADDRWLDEVPSGVLKETAQRLRELADPQTPGRPDYATPEVAARAMLELYALLSAKE